MHRNPSVNAESVMLTMARSKESRLRSKIQAFFASAKEAFENGINVWGKYADLWPFSKTIGRFCAKNRLLAILRKKYVIMWRGLKIPPPLFSKAQAAHPLPAPFSFPTPFRKARYQRIAGFAERCSFSCERTTVFTIRGNIFKNFSVFHKKETAFLDRIRGPPSEI